MDSRSYLKGAATKQRALGALPSHPMMMVISTCTSLKAKPRAFLCTVLQAACADQGLEVGLLNQEDMRSRCSSLQLPPGAAGLWQRDAAVIRALDMTAAISTLAQRAGVMVKAGAALSIKVEP